MRVNVLKAEALYVASFARPAYAFVSEWAKLLAAINTRLDARAEDVRFESASNHPNDFHLAWTDYRNEVVARFRLNSLELWTKNPKLVEGPEPPFVGLLLRTVAAVGELVPGIEFQSQRTNFQCHGRLVETTVDELLRGLLRGTEWASPNGASFRLTAPTGVKATADLLPSLAFVEPHGLWGGITLDWPGDRPPAEAIIHTASFVGEVLAKAGVDLDWTDVLGGAGG